MNRSRQEIKIEQDSLLRLLPHVNVELSKLQGVDFVGVGVKEKDDQLTDQLCYRVYVQEKISKEKLLLEDLIPSYILGKATDVVLTGETFDCVVDDDRERPLLGGIHIRNDKYGNQKSHSKTRGVGTLGCLATRNSDGAVVGLSAEHVFLSANSLMAGTEIGQPRYVKCCAICTYNKIGEVVATDTPTDSAIVEIKERLVIGSNGITPMGTIDLIKDIGAISGVSGLQCFDIVSKRGACTGVTTGTVVDVAFEGTKMLIGASAGTANNRFADFGDSGAVLLNQANKVIGLVIGAQRVIGPTRATHRQQGVVQPIRDVLLALDISIAGESAAAIVPGAPAACEWFSWPGGQGNTALNPAETFTSVGMGLGATADWDVSLGGVEATIVEKDGVPGAYGNNVATAASIKVRYDIVSATSTILDVVTVEGTANIGGVINSVARTIFMATPRAVNTSAVLDSDNALLFPATGGVTTNLAGLVTPGVDGAAWFMGKADITWDISPTGITWSTSNVNTVFEQAPDIPFVTNSKFELTARRESEKCLGDQVAGAMFRTHTSQVWGPDQLSGIADYQAQTDALPDEIFRIGTIGFDPSLVLQSYVRANFKDYLAFHNGDGWVQITPSEDWLVNLTGDLSGAGFSPPSIGANNNIGLGATLVPIPNTAPILNAGIDRFVAVGRPVTLEAIVSDLDDDSFVFGWTQDSGSAIALAGNVTIENFNAPAAPSDLVFTATAIDSTQGLLCSNGDAESTATITIKVADWKVRCGGHVDPTKNEIETFASTDFGFAGAVDWDLSAGGVSATIIEKDGVPGAYGDVVAGATTIVVRYDLSSGSNDYPDATFILVTNPGDGATAGEYRSVYKIEVAVHTTDNHTHIIPSTLGAAGDIHFCTAQGQGNTILDATFTPSPNSANVSWNAAGAFAFTVPGVGGDTTTASISSNTGTGQEIGIDITISGHKCFEARYWTIWTAAPTVVNGGAAVPVSVGVTQFSGSITHTYTIQPATITTSTPTVDDLPDLTGVNNSIAGAVVNPPAVPAVDVNVQNSGANDLDNGVDAKWDVSRQNIQKPIGLATIPDSVANAVAQGAGDLFVLYANFPSDALAGNDDKGTGDEDNNPYAAGVGGLGNIFSSDGPGRPLLHSDGAEGDTFELRLHFREFSRVLLDDTWYPISGFSLWKIHMVALKANEANDATDYDGDGFLTSDVWIDNGSVVQQNNIGF
jgi:hypothetical protein